MSATTLASSILVMAEADNFMSRVAAKTSMNNVQKPVYNQNNLKDVSIFSMKKPNS